MLNAIKYHIGYIVFLALMMPSTSVAASEPNKWAIVIGITKYLHYHDQDGDLEFAADDAKAFRDFLLSPSGGSLPADNVHLLVNEGARRENINGSIKWLKERVESAHDVVYVFLSGHGRLSGSENVRLIPYDGSDNDYLNDSILLDVFLRDLNTEVDPKIMAIFIDVCHAGAALTPQNTIAPAARSRLIFASSGIKQKSRESRSLGRSIFAHYLLRALNQDVEANADRNVLASAVVPWVIDRVATHAMKEFNVEQSPVASPNFDPNLRLAKRLPGPPPEPPKPAPAPGRSPPPASVQPSKKPWTKTGWFWGLMGGVGAAVVAGMTVGLVVGLHPCFGCIEQTLTY